MMRKARLAIRKVNVALDSPGYYFGTGRSRCFPRSFTLIPRTARCLRQLPSCVAVSRAIPVATCSMSLSPNAPLYLVRSRSSRPLPRGCTGHVTRPRALHSLNRDVFYITDPISSIDQSVNIRDCSVQCQSPFCSGWFI